MCAAVNDALPVDALSPALKVAALLATGYAVHRSLSPPNPPPAPKTCVDNRTLFERAIRHVTFCTKMMTWTAVIADALVTVHLASPSLLTRPIATALLPSISSQNLTAFSTSLDTFLSASPPSLPSPDFAPLAHTLLQPSVLLLMGASAAVLGAALRLACFRALGKLFTFEITISPSHTLVTSGPYAHVRHPSYTGVYATLLGASAVMLGPGAWLREAWLAPAALAACGLGGLPGVGLGGARAAFAWAFALFWTVKVYYAMKSTMKRVATEDGALHHAFGAQWEEWAARVRWRLLPGVY